MFKKSILYIAATALLGVSCIYPYNADIPEETKNALVVDGKIVIGGYSTVTLSQLLSLKGRAEGIPSGDVFLEEENGATYTGVLMRPGQYSIPAQEANPDSRYRLRVESGGKTYSTDWITLIAAPDIEDLNISADRQNVNVLLSFSSRDEGYGYAAVSFQEIWYFHVEYLQMLTYDPESNSVAPITSPDLTYYYCWNKTSYSNEKIIDYSYIDKEVKGYKILSFSRMANRNHGDYTIKIRLRNLTEQEYRYKKNLDEASSMGSSLFTPEPGEIESNIRCISDEDTPVYGYVNISKVSVATAHMDGRYFKTHTPSPLMLLDPADYYDYYTIYGYVPVDMTSNDTGSGPGWGLKSCVNCVAAGGTLEKPDFD